MATTNWIPNEKNWGQLAYDEVMKAFDGQLKNRAVALCVWRMATQPDVTQNEIERTAMRDPEIETRQDGTKINDYSMRQAKRILHGEPAKPKKKRTPKRSKNKSTKTRSKLEAAVLARFQASADLVDEVTRLTEELQQLQEACDAARAALAEIPREHAVTIADVDPKAAEILEQEGLLQREPTA